MRFTTRLIACMVSPVLVVGAAAIVGLFGLRGAGDRFEHFFQVDQRLAEATHELYVQGLQMGQATRNIVLDPANPKAWQNLEAAAGEYERAAATAATTATGDAATTAALGEIATLRAEHRRCQQQILEVAKTDGKAAISLLNKSETPAWRALKAKVLDLDAVLRARMQATRDAALADTAKKELLLTACALLGLVACGAAAWVLLRVLRRDLGGEPETVRETMAAVAAGELRRQVPLRAGDRHSLFFFVEQMRQSLQHLIGGVRQSVDAITNALTEIATGNTDLAQRTCEQATNLANASSSLGQVTTTVQANTENAQQANQLAAAAAAVAQRGGTVVGEVVTTMHTITEQSRKIGEIVGVIDGIAFQTNLLALNAAVEAARAGEHGRGFAVVAEEVRGLAQRAATAAREIGSLIAASVQQVETGSRLVDQAGCTIQEVVTKVGDVSGLVAGITEATIGQSQGIEQVHTAVTQLDQATQQNAALVEESAAVATSLREQAQQLATAIGVFRVAD